MQDTKTCYKCLREFPLSSEHFYRSKTEKSGWKHICKECCKKVINEYRLHHKKEIRQTRKAYNESHKEEIKKYGKEYYKKNKIAENKNSAKYYQDNKPKVRIKYKKYRDKYYQDHRAAKLSYAKQYKVKNRVSINKKLVDRKHNDVNFRMTCNLRSRVLIAVKNQGTLKSKKTMELIGCSVAELRKHLESKFLKGMSWSNYGKNGWEIDHIVPCGCFDLTKEEEQRKCFNWSNLQPLWQKDNSAKNHTYMGKGFRKNSII